MTTDTEQLIEVKTENRLLESGDGYYISYAFYWLFLIRNNSKLQLSSFLGFYISSPYNEFFYPHNKDYIAFIFKWSQTVHRLICSRKKQFFFNCIIGESVKIDILKG